MLPYFFHSNLHHPAFQQVYKLMLLVDLNKIQQQLMFSFFSFPTTPFKKSLVCKLALDSGARPSASRGMLPLVLPFAIRNLCIPFYFLRFFTHFCTCFVALSFVATVMSWLQVREIIRNSFWRRISKLFPS